MDDVLRMDRAALMVQLGQMEAHAEWCEARAAECERNFGNPGCYAEAARMEREDIARLEAQLGWTQV